MQTLNANEAKTKFETMLINIQREPVEIMQNGSSVAVVMSTKDYLAMEELKMELVKLRFSNVDEVDLVAGDTFFEDLESGKYD